MGKRLGQTGLEARIHMTPNELVTAGRALYGERWQTSLATDLQVADRTMRRWLAGETLVPDGVERELREILIKRVKEISNLIGYAVNLTDRSVLHYPTNAQFRFDELGNVTLTHHGVAPWQDVSGLAEGAKEAVRQERGRDNEIDNLSFNPAFLAVVERLELSVRTANSLKNENIVYIGDLVQKTEAELLRMPYFSRRSLNEIREILVAMGLRLGMEVEGWPPGNIETLAKAYATWAEGG